jgi:hypothetical protein
MSNLLKNFTLERVISSVSPKVLQDYFHNKNLFMDIEDFAKIKKQNKADAYKEHIVERVIKLGDIAGAIVNDFKQIYILSKKAAYLALIDNIRQQQKYKYLIEHLTDGSLESDYDKLFFLVHKEPDFIHDFYLVYSLNVHTEGFWNRRHSNIPTREENIIPEEIKALEDEIKRSLKEQTRGKNCKVQHVAFDGKDHFFALAEDLPITMAHWKNDSSEYILLRPSFEIAFVYDKNLGELDVCCEEGGKKIRTQMQLSFARAVLGQEIPEQQKDDEAYDLKLILDQLLKNKQVEFYLHVSKNIKDIFIRSIKFQGRGYRRDNITLDTALNERVSTILYNHSCCHSNTHQEIELKTILSESLETPVIEEPINTTSTTSSTHIQTDKNTTTNSKTNFNPVQLTLL